MVKQQIEQDLKTALLSGDSFRATVLRGIKSAILYVEVAEKKRDGGLSQAEIESILQKEVKKRKESADLYHKAGDAERAAGEEKEIAIIQAYLPEQISDAALIEIVEKAIADAGAVDMRSMGAVIAAVKQKTQSGADGARIAQLVKERLQ